MTTTDYIGIGTLITAAAAAVVSIIVALRQSQTHAAVAEVQQAVQTSNGATIGEIIEANDITGVSGDPHRKVEP